jgi:hypothetical protein
MIAAKTHCAEQVALRFESKLRIWMLMPLIVLGAISTPCTGLASHMTSIEGRRPSYWGSVRDNGFVASVTMQPTVLPLDMNSGNSIKAEAGGFKPVTYLFGERILNRRALARIDTIYQVARTRRVPIVSTGGDWVIAEFFRAGSHVPQCRYEMLGKSVRTQYILDPRGRVVRIADVGWQTDVADPRRSGNLRVGPGKHATWIRVFDVSGNRALNLIAAAWVVDAGERGPDDSPPLQGQLRFGNAKGKSIWVDQRRFESALGLDLTARAIAVSND